MNLKRRLLLTSSAIVLITVTLTMVAYVLLSRMQFHIHSVTEEYAELQQIEQIDNHLTLARTELLSDDPILERVTAEARAAMQEIAEYIGEQDEQLGTTPEHSQLEESKAYRVSERITEMLDRLDPSVTRLDPATRQIILDDIAAIHNGLLTLAHAADDLVDDALLKTHDTIALANVLMLGLCALGAGLAIGFTVLQYRWFITPIQRLRDRVHKTVSSGPVQSEASGNDLIGDLNAGFTELVAELNTFYRTLEERVNTQSRELVLSERLASVGYLAAGIAHEINNPLNTILGYAELMLRSLNQKQEHVASQDIETLEVIRNETYRCRQIVEKLLSLVRPSDAPREPVDMAGVAREVVSMLDTLKQFRRCTFELDLPDSEPLIVSARESEMKQILINLVINAAEATSDTDGRVTISGRLTGDRVVLHVQDNGRGMDQQTRARVFEPFFTQKRGSGQSGTGLGLSIVHAIVTDHQGAITADSPGPGRGSCFTIDLPLHQGSDT